MIPMDCAFPLNEGEWHPEWLSCVPNYCNPAGIEETIAANTTLLLPPAPNPFNRTTTLQYQLAKPGEIRIEIYDAAGRMIRNLLSGYQNEGMAETN